MTGIGVAQVRRDATVLSLELLDHVKGVPQAGDRRVQPPAGNEQQREAGTGLLIVDPNRTRFVEGHGTYAFPSLLAKHAPHGGHRRRRGARCQYFASDQIHIGVLLDREVLRVVSRRKTLAWANRIATTPNCKES